VTARTDVQRLRRWELGPTGALRQPASVTKLARGPALRIHNSRDRSFSSSCSV
jgi:hypothetical protein